MLPETAGDPMSELKWTRKTTARVAEQLALLGLRVSPNTVARLLKQMHYALRVNHKQLSRVCKTPREQRNAQFEHIATLREECATHSWPLLSVDSKKKELIGPFKNPGVAWSRQPVQVYDHDFVSDASGKAAPYGIYDVLANRGTVYLGTSYDTAEFAVDALAAWWIAEGRVRYPAGDRLFLLADGGGSNSCVCRAWKMELYRKLVVPHRLTVTVAHYPPGASKWNPVEHRLFGPITGNWAGRPLDSFQTALNYIRTTTTRTGLQVQAHLLDRPYEKGVHIADADMRALPITYHDPLPRWNYTLTPRTP